ncbi:MAG: methylmalonyl-CoA epimerase [Ignavibacteriae bacterium]|nr:methylmalonyl-CoA epimerase [Ignavibacteriota bacterium]
MIKKLSHVGIAVKDLEASVQLFSKLFSIQNVENEVIEDQKVKVAFFRIDGTSVELTAAVTPDSVIAKFIQKHGEGVHHLSFEVDDIRAELSRLRAEGFQLIDEEPRRGAGGYLIAFLHPKSTNGVLIEISQKLKS